MTFNDFLSQGWRDHGDRALEVAGRFSQGLTLIESADQIAAAGQLIAHVMGEHLQRWSEGVNWLEKLKAHKCCGEKLEARGAVDRLIAGLQLAEGARSSVEDLSRSDQIRVLAMAASSLCGVDVRRAKDLFQAALAKARSGLEKADAANRSLAVTGNNLACALEEKVERSEDERELMILAAQAGRTYWEIAGTWLEVERAEYRLSQTFLKAGDANRAKYHAEACLRIIGENAGSPLEYFFGYEAMAMAEKALGSQEKFVAAKEEAKLQFAKLAPEDQKWCKASLEALGERA